MLYIKKYFYLLFFPLLFINNSKIVAQDLMPDLLPKAGCAYDNNDMFANGCYNGWDLADGSPNKWGSDGVQIWCANGGSEAVMAEFNRPLKVGKKYKLELQYRVSNWSLFDDVADLFYLEFSSSKKYRKPTGEIILLRTDATIKNGIKMMKSDTVTLLNQQSKLLTITEPGADIVDNVLIGGNNRSRVVQLNNISNVDEFLSVTSEFEALHSSKYVFFCQFTSGNQYQSIIFRLVNIVELDSDPIIAPVSPICYGESTLINASGASLGGVYRWYTNASGGSSIYQGVQFHTSTLYSNTTYYVEVDYGWSVTERVSVAVIVNPIPAVSFTGLENNYYLSATSVPMTGTPSGGTFSGTGISGNIFNPSIAGLGDHTITYSFTDNGCTGNATQTVSVIESDPLCSSSIPSDGSGQFVLDTFSGRIVYQRSESCAEDIDMSCIGAQPNPPTIPNVVASSMSTISDEWDYTPYYQDKYSTALASANSFEKGTKGKWRPSGSYAYNTDALTQDKNYNTGTYDMALFSWQHPEANQRKTWIPTSTIDKYSPHGEALQERNALDIASTVKMGYYDALPYLTAQNAAYESVFFESFEMTYNGTLESNLILYGSPTITSITAHGGHQSLAINSATPVMTPVMRVAAANTDIMMQVWVKGQVIGEMVMYLRNEDNTSNLAVIDMIQVTRSGDWGLYQAVLNSGTSTAFRAQSYYNGTGTIWIDDVRVQPLESEMTCYVYDPATLRLLTIFDGQHFGLYYQYNGEGKLVRKMIETERGIRTIQETFYNTPTVNK